MSAPSNSIAAFGQHSSSICVISPHFVHLPKGTCFDGIPLSIPSFSKIKPVTFVVICNFSYRNFSYMLESEFEKLAIIEIESEGIEVFKTPKFSDRKHRQRDKDLGAPDLWLFYRDRTTCLELKAEKGRQSDEQKRFEARMRRVGIPYYIAYDLDDVDNVIIAVKSL
jgi:hypothetical protein